MKPSRGVRAARGDLLRQPYHDLWGHRFQERGGKARGHFFGGEGRGHPSLRSVSIQASASPTGGWQRSPDGGPRPGGVPAPGWLRCSPGRLNYSAWRRSRDQAGQAECSARSLREDRWLFGSVGEIRLVLTPEPPGLNLIARGSVAHRGLGMGEHDHGIDAPPGVPYGPGRGVRTLRRTELLDGLRPQLRVRSLLKPRPLSSVWHQPTPVPPRLGVGGGVQPDEETADGVTDEHIGARTAAAPRAQIGNELWRGPRRGVGWDLGCWHHPGRWLDRSCGAVVRSPRPSRRPTAAVSLSPDSGSPWDSPPEQEKRTIPMSTSAPGRRPEAPEWRGQPRLCVKGGPS